MQEGYAAPGGPGAAYPSSSVERQFTAIALNAAFTAVTSGDVAP